MWPQKLIQSSLLPCGVALALMAGCASADRTEARTDDSAARDADVNGAGRSPAGPANDGHDKDSEHRTPKGGSKPSRAVRSDSVVTASPSLDELPNLKPLHERSIAAHIDVEGSQTATKRPVVPAFKEIPLTAEEKKALGKDRERPDDVMGFYKPGRSVEHGVSPRESDIRVGVGGWGGAQVGTSGSPPRAGVFGDAGHHAKVSTVARTTSGVDTYVPVIVRVGPSFVVQIGWGPPRTGAMHMPYLEP
jgi:hypothetical protein